MFGFGFSPVIGGGGGAVSYHADAETWFELVETYTTISEPRKQIYSDLFSGLEADGNSNQIDRLFIFAAENSAAALISLYSNGSAHGILNEHTHALAVNSPTFTTDRGYAGNASTSYVNTNFIMDSGANYILNNSSIGAYIRTNSASDSIDVGALDGTDAANFAPNYTGVFYGRMNNAWGSYLSQAVTDSNGLIVLSRQAADTLKYWRNGSVVKTQGSINSSAIPAIAAFVAGINADGSLAYPGARQFAAVYFASGDLDHAAMYTRLQTFMTEIGANV